MLAIWRLMDTCLCPGWARSSRGPFKEPGRRGATLKAAPHSVQQPPGIINKCLCKAVGGRTPARQPRMAPSMGARSTGQPSLQGMVPPAFPPKAELAGARGVQHPPDRAGLGKGLGQLPGGQDRTSTRIPCTHGETEARAEESCHFARTGSDP